jgi:hypothetical protein
MSNTKGFQIVAEVSVSFLRAVLRAAWKSGGKKLGESLDPGTIPESFDLEPGSAFGSFVLKDGQIQIPQDGLDVALVADKGVDIKIGLRGQAHLQNAQNPLVPSLSLRDITADVHVVAPVGPLVGPGHVPHEVGVDFKAAQKPTVKLTGSDPAARLDALIEEYVQSLARTAPKLSAKPDVPIQYKGVTAYHASELLQILVDDARRVEVTRVAGMPPQLKLSIPVEFSFYKVEPLASEPPPPLLEGFLVEARLVAVAVLEDGASASGGYVARFDAPTTVVTVEAIKPGGAVSQYTGNQLRLGSEFDLIVKAHVRQRGMELLKQLGNVPLTIPTVASIEAALANMLQTKVAALDSIAIWPPKAGADAALPVVDVRVKVLSEALVLAINPGAGADASVLQNFLGGRDLVVALSSEGVQAIFEWQKAKTNPFHRYHDDESNRDFDLKSLALSLKSGAVHFDGEMTIIDAIAGSIDVDASFGVDVHLSWGPKNQIKADPDKPDVDADISGLGWLLSLVLGFVTGGAMGVLIVAVVDMVAESTASSIGEGIVDDPDFKGVAAWPIDLPKIGSVAAAFDNPIDISPDGLQFSAVVTP